MLRFAMDMMFKAAIYLRLSKEDGGFSYGGGKQESDSIASQRMLIRDFLKQHPEIEVVREYCDDGYTGANFERPQFQKMMDAVKAGEINCIVVKDLSRFGREYIDSGYYLQKVFPMLGVRFIAINDHYDNAKPGAADDELVLPFKNLMNDSYCRDISIKVRSNLEAKRGSGQFVGSKVPYGYMRSPENKNKLVIDPPAAKIVRSIFRWKIEGMSPGQIAKKLNDDGVLSPIEYKKAQGSKQRTVFQTQMQAKWFAGAIYRILGNEVYTGTLLQGKTTTPNHKVKKTIRKDESEWARTENAHEPIIVKTQFDLVQRLMREDTRSPSGSKPVYPFSGKIFCSDCGSAMIRRVARCGEHEYVYYICSGKRKDATNCTSHSIKEELVSSTVLAVLQAHIASALNLEAAMEKVDALAWENRELDRLRMLIAIQEEQISRNRRLKTDAYEDFRHELLSREEYETFRVEFDRKIREANDAISRLHRDQNRITGGLSAQQGWLSQFRQYQNIQELSRSVVVNLVDKIIIHDNKDIDVQLLYQDQFAAIVQFLKEQKMAKKTQNRRVISGRAM